MALGQVVAAGRQAGHRADQRPGRIGRQDQHKCGQRRQPDPEHGQQQQRQGTGGDQAAAQVVQHLPAVDAAQRPALRVQQEGQQLPVAAHPSVQPGGGHVGMEGRLFDQRHIGQRGAAHQRALQQVVAEHRALGQPSAQHGMQGGHVEQALAGEAALAEQVLVDLGTGGAVGVDPALSGKQPVERRGLAGGRQRRDQTRLQDGVARHHALAAGVQARLVVGVGGHADQFAQTPGRQLGVAVQGQHMARAGGQARLLAQVCEGRAGGRGQGGGGLGVGRAVGGADQGGDELFELAAFALPADPALLADAELALPVQQHKARCGVALRQRAFRALVQRPDRGAGLGQQRGVALQVRTVGVGPVAEQGELGVTLGVGQGVQVQAVDQLGHRRRVAEHGRDHHHHPLLGRNAIGQAQSRLVPRRRRFADQTVDNGHQRFGAWHQHQQPDQPGRPARRRPRPRPRAEVQQQPGAQPQAAGAQQPQVGRQGQAPGAGQPCRAPAQAQSQRPVERCPTGAVQPKTGARAGLGQVRGWRIGRPAHQGQQSLGHGQLAALGAPRQALDGVQRAVAGGAVFGREQGRGEQAVHQRAGVPHHLGPVGVADAAQGGHGVADRQVVGGLLGAAARLNGHRVGQRLGQPGLDGGRAGHAGAGAVVLQTLRHLGQKGVGQAALAKLLGHLGQAGHAAALDLVATQVGHLARGLVQRQALGQAAQVLDQHHAQGGGQGPQLGQMQLAGLLVGAQVGHQQRFVESAVGVGHKGPGHAVDPWQADQGLVAQRRQAAKVAPRQPFVDRLQLRFDQVKVVQQPLGRRPKIGRHVGLGADVGVRQAQPAQVLKQARKEYGLARLGAHPQVGQTQALAVLGKALGAKNLGPHRRQHSPLRGAENGTQLGRCVGDQAQPVSLAQPQARAHARPSPATLRRLSTRPPPGPAW